MAAKKNTRSTTPRPRRKPVTQAPTVPINEALNHALAWWDEYDALEDLDLGDTLEAVVVAANALGLNTVRDLHGRGAEVIVAVTGVIDLNQFTTAATAERLHQARNGVAAITLATEIRHGTDSFGPYDLIKTLPRIAARHGDKSRPATDDEILLTRSATIHALRRGGRYTRGASQYALAESAAHPMETTAIRPCDFDNLQDPTTVLLHGGTWYQERRVVLTPFARRVLATTLDAFLAARPGSHQASLCFDGTTKASASASSSNNLKHLAERVGITSPSLEGAFATRWRAHKELRDAGGCPHCSSWASTTPSASRPVASTNS